MDDLSVWQWLMSAARENGAWFSVAIFMMFCMLRAAKWFGPRADRVIDTHIKTLDTLSDSSRVTEKAVNEISTTVKEIKEQTHQSHKVLDEIHDQNKILSEIHLAVRGLQK
jgi:hypothetical protein